MVDTDVTIDTHALDAIRALQQPGTEDLVSKIISMFLEDAIRYRDEIGAAIREGSPERVGVAAHSLKSCAANVGAMQVSAAAAALETLGRHLDAAAERVALEPLLGDPNAGGNLVGVGGVMHQFQNLVANYLDAYGKTGVLTGLRKKWFEESDWIAALP